MASVVQLVRSDRRYLVERGRRLALAVLSVALLVAGLEFLLAFSPAPSPHLHRSNRGISVAVDCYPTNPRGYFDLDLREPAALRYLETAKVRKIGDCSAKAPYAVEFRYNKLQFRDVDPRPRRVGVRRIVVLGDSFTEGQGVKERDTWGRRLEAQLNALGPGRWEVLNFGRRGADFPALRDNFEVALEQEPDITIYGMMLNDAVRSEALAAELGRLFNRESLVTPAAQPRLRLLDFARRRLASVRMTGETTRWYNRLYSEANGAGWRETRNYILEMDQRMKHRGGRFILMLWPVLAGLDREYPIAQAHEAISGFCRAADVRFVDLLRAFQGWHDDDLWVHVSDTHPNDVAHDIAASRVRPFVLQSGEDFGRSAREGDLDARHR